MFLPLPYIIFSALALLIAGYAIGIQVERRRNARYQASCRYRPVSMYEDPGTTPAMYTWAKQDRWN